MASMERFGTAILLSLAITKVQVECRGRSFAYDWYYEL
jgi:hypothetical protein